MAVTIQATTPGNTNVADNWTDVGDSSHRLPIATDNVDLNGNAMVQVGAIEWLSLVDVAGGGSLAITNDFACPTVTDATLTCSAHKLATADVPATAANGAFTVGSDVHASYPFGMRFLASGTVGGTNDGEYVVDFPGSSFASGVTTIPCTVAKRPSNQASETGTLQRWSPAVLSGDVTNANSHGIEVQSGGMIDPTDATFISGQQDCAGISVAAGGMVYGDCVGEGTDPVGNNGIHSRGTIIGDCVGTATVGFGMDIDAGLLVGDSVGTATSGYGFATGSTTTIIGNCVGTATESGGRGIDNQSLIIGNCTGTTVDEVGVSNTGTIIGEIVATATDPSGTSLSNSGVIYNPLASAVFPDAANVSTVETAYGPTGDEYAGQMEVATLAEAIAAGVDASQTGQDLADGGRLDSAIDQIAADVAGLEGEAMRGTDGAAVPGDAMALTTGERITLATAVWASTTRTLSSFGTLIASIWAYATRTLTGSASATGPTVATSPGPIYFPCQVGDTLGLYAHVRGWDGTDLMPADVSSIAYSITDHHDEEIEGHAAIVLTIADVLFETLQTDAWASDYNFKFIPSIVTNAAFASRGEYRVDVTITLVSGEPIGVHFVVKVQG